MTKLTHLDVRFLTFGFCLCALMSKNLTSKLAFGTFSGMCPERFSFIKTMGLVLCGVSLNLGQAPKGLGPFQLCRLGAVGITGNHIIKGVFFCEVSSLGFSSFFKLFLLCPFVVLKFFSWSNSHEQVSPWSNSNILNNFPFL